MTRALPENLITSLKGVNGFEEASFRQVHSSGEQVTSIRTNPAKITIEKLSLPVAGAVPWAVNGWYLTQRPSFTFDPLFHAGCYYVQEASSMFLEEAFRQTVDGSLPLKVLDLCASPGGKSTHLQTLISPQSILVSNEVVKGRNNVLVDNISKWGAANVVVTANDARAFQKLPNYFDVMVVDAPCSGSGLFRRDEGAMDEWSLHNVQLCSDRQKRILNDALPTLKNGGILIYATCSYSKEEDEDIMDWLVQEMHCQPLPISIENATGVVASHSPISGATGYRFFPDRVKGEGFFMAVFRKEGEEENEKVKGSKVEKIGTKQKEIISRWLKDWDGEVVALYNGLYLASPNLYEQLSFLQKALNIQYAGVGAGSIMKEKLVPAHALAMSNLLSDAIPKTNLSYEDAIKYLQRSDFKLTSERPGWQVVCYQEHNLGWINALQNRFNNYYPKELRILKQHNHLPFKK